MRLCIIHIIYFYIYVCLLVNILVYDICIFMCVCVFAGMCVCWLYVYVRAYVYVCICVYAYVCIYVCTYLCVNII